MRNDHETARLATVPCHRLPRRRRPCRRGRDRAADRARRHAEGMRRLPSRLRAADAAGALLEEADGRPRQPFRRDASLPEATRAEIAAYLAANAGDAAISKNGRYFLRGIDPAETPCASRRRHSGRASMRRFPTPTSPAPRSRRPRTAWPVAGPPPRASSAKARIGITPGFTASSLRWRSRQRVRRLQTSTRDDAQRSPLSQRLDDMVLVARAAATAGGAQPLFWEIERERRIGQPEDPPHLDVGGKRLRLFQPRRGGEGGRARRRLAPAVLAEGAAREPAALRGRPHRHASTTSRRWPPGSKATPLRARDRLPPGARADAGLHRRAGGGRSGGDARRDAVELGGDPKKINPLSPVDLVIDHSVQVDDFGTPRRLRRATSSIEYRAQRRALSPSCAGASRPSTISASCRRAPASATRSTSNTWRRWSGPTRARTATHDRLSRHPGRHRQPHHDGQRPGACSAGASAASRPRRRCSASRSRC